MASGSGSFYELKRDGHTYEMAAANLTTTNIGLVFGLDPKSVWLKEANGDRCYFPVGELFEISDFSFSYTLFVKGTPPISSDKRASPLSLSAMESPASTSNSASSPLYKGIGGQRGCMVKVVKAEKNGTKFISIGQMFIEVSPSNANIDFIQSEVQLNWGEDYVVVSNDGLKITDSAATRGIKFWKVGSRKLFAIREKGKKRKRDESSDEEKKNCSLLNKLDLVNAKVSQILEVNSHLSLPLGFASIIYEAFKCSICLMSPITPPAIVGKCCKRIVGCQKCIDEWYGGDDRMMKRCPLCQGDRGFADTMILLGIEEFLTSLSNINSLSPQQRSYVPPAPVEVSSDISD